MDKEYIEREAVKEVIKQLSREPTYQHDGEDYYMGVCAVDGEIAMLPAADVAEVRHGEWIIETPNNRKFITCSACRSVIDCLYTNIDENEFDYCPYCDAKMDGKGEPE